MGVPALFKWLRRRFPRAITDAVEEEASACERDPGAFDWSGPNPLGCEVDCLYLDMNGVLHACTHPPDRPAPPSLPAMLDEICAYVDRLCALARPRALLVLAVDGVAPRAKMNQQRARRFMAAREAAVSDRARHAAADEWRARGFDPSAHAAGGGAAPPAADADAADAADADAAESASGMRGGVFDHTCITPGTAFMAAASARLHAHVLERLAAHPAWASLAVVFSDAAEPGEGEHKIQALVRAARACGAYGPRLTHAVYGLDADLLLLGLCLHEPRWLILRETVESAQPAGAGSSVAGGGARGRGAARGPVARCPLCRREGHAAASCELALLAAAPGATRAAAAPMPLIAHRPFTWVNLGVLREYLAHLLGPGGCALPPPPAAAAAAGAQQQPGRARAAEGGRGRGPAGAAPALPAAEAPPPRGAPPSRADPSPPPRRHLEPARFDLEIAIDDLVLLSFLAGNDFLPHLPGLEVHAGAMDALLGAYTSARARAPAGLAPLVRRGAVQRAPLLCVLRALAEAEERAHARARARALRADEARRQRRRARPVGGARHTASALPACGDGAAGSLEAEAEAAEAEGGSAAAFEALVRAHTAALLAAEGAEAEEEEGGGGAAAAAAPAAAASAPAAAAPAPPLAATAALDYRACWYAERLGGAFARTAGAVRGLCRDYLRGLQWVATYYWRGCGAWRFGFEHHYAPFASDLVAALEALDDAAFGALLAPTAAERAPPLRPLRQLMAVLPPASAHCVPPPYRPLMLDAASPLARFYPRAFKLDLRGCTEAWQGVALLPFIQLDALEAALDTLDASAPRRPPDGPGAPRRERGALSAAERARDQPAPARLYARAQSELGGRIRAACAAGAAGARLRCDAGVPVAGRVWNGRAAHPPARAGAPAAARPSSAVLVADLQVDAPAADALRFGRLEGASSPPPVLALDDVVAAADGAERALRELTRLPPPAGAAGAGRGEARDAAPPRSGAPRARPEAAGPEQPSARAPAKKKRRHGGAKGGARDGGQPEQPPPAAGDASRPSAPPAFDPSTCIGFSL